MQTLQFVLIIFQFEAPVLLREVTCDVFLSWLYWEFTAVAVIALYLCQDHVTVLLLSDEAGSMQSANQISLEMKCYLFLEWKGSGNTQELSQLSNNWRSDLQTRNIRQKKHLKVMKRIFLCFCISIEDGSGAVQCTSSHAAVVLGDVYDTVQTQNR